MKEISSAIQTGAKAFLNEVYKILFVFVLVVFFLLFYFLNFKIALAFLLGAIFSVLAGNIGMRVATMANSKTAEGVKKDIFNGLKIAFSSGLIMGLMVVSFGIFGITLLYFLFKDLNIIYGFGFGASGVAIFARVGGGLYTKAADVGADLVGKVEMDIPEDDPRNPAVIADNVGDNVGDVAGMGADLFESYVDSIIAAMAIGVLLVKVFGQNIVILPLILAGVGLFSSIFGYLVSQFIKAKKPSLALNLGVWISSGVMLLSSYFIINKFIVNGLNFFISTLLGLVSGLIIGFVSEYFTSSDYSPTKKVAEASQRGTATNIIMGLGVGMKSTAIPIITVSIVMILAYKLSGIYGVALSGVGMLSTLGITLATDCYGPVADNAAGIAEMAHLGEEVRKKAESLDALGNTTAAVGKGFAIGSAALTALALVISYLEVAKLEILDLKNPWVIAGVFLGGLLPYLISSLVMESVGKTASKVVDEVRQQFKEIEGLKEGKAKPDYKKCVETVTRASLKQMIAPGVITILSPLIVGYLLGKEALGGLLVGALASGFLLAIMMANSGGSWDNAKKYIEAGNFGGKHSDSHKAAVIGDTVGDPFKD
ncbi:MAG: sodium-translocating pyrophosphatase, partial [Minisyncoccia bacterium]